MKLNIIVLAVIGVSIFALPSCGMAMTDGQITVVVTDETGRPISNATAGAFFPGAYGAGAPVKGESVKAVTNLEGRAILKGTTTGTVAGGVECPGYYRTQFSEVDFIGKRQRGEKLTVEKEVYLKPISNPIALSAHLFREKKLPQLNKPFGFDLKIGDWIAPDGRGATTDIIFEIKGRHESYREHDLTLEVSFPNPGDGLVEFEGVRNLGSELRSAHLAPADGYTPRLSFHRKALHAQNSSQWINESKPGSNYYLRLRTVLDNEGKVISAHYGKIYGNFEFLDFIKAEAMYFNPTPNDRNLEFDPRNNLANPANARDKVRIP